MISTGICPQLGEIVMNPVKRIKAFCKPPQRKLRPLEGPFIGLALELQETLNLAETDPLPALVRFFDAVSPWHDRGLREECMAFRRLDDGQYTSTIEKIVTLNSQFARAGRTDCGLNRTTIGEKVTADNVWIGGVYGIYTFAVRRWMDEFRNHPAHDGLLIENKTPFQIAEMVARDFVTGHAPIMIERLRELRSYSILN